MKNVNFTKSLTAGVVLALALYPQAWAGVATPCGQQAGDTSSNCWSCGADCSARLDSTGKLSIYGSGKMNNYDWHYASSDERALYGNTFATTAPWHAKIGEVTSIDVQGVTNIGYAAFIGMKRVTSFNIGDSVTTIGSNGLCDCNFSDIYFPPSVISVGEDALSVNPNLTRVVSSIDSIGNQYGVSSNVYYKYKQEGDLIYMYDKDNNIKGIFDSQSDLKDVALENGQARIEYGEDNSFTVYNLTGDNVKKYLKGADGLISTYDANGNVIAKYDADNNLLSSYSYASDGSVYSYDANGKLTGAKKKTPFTPAEAAALIKKGNNNRVTLTIK